MWSLLLALLCGAGLVAGAPQGLEGRSSSDLPMEHRGQNSDPIDVIGELFDALFRSETASAIDEAASQFTSVVGGIVDDIGDFVVGTVKEIPGTIDRISERVGEAVQNGEETVVIIVKGVRNTVRNATSNSDNTVVRTVDQVFNAVNQSKTLSSLEELEKSIRLSIARIGGTVLANIDDIDSALADGIRTVTRRGNNTSQVESKPTTSQFSFELPENPPSAENEVRSN